MAIRAQRSVAAFQDQYLQETVTLVTLLTILVLEGLMDHLVAELGAHGFVAIDTLLTHLAPRGWLRGTAVRKRKDEYAKCEKIKGMSQPEVESEA